MQFDPKIGHVICDIRRIPCVCAECASMLYKPWVHGLPSQLNRATNLSQIVLNDKFSGHLTTRIASHCHTNQQQVSILIVFIRLHLMASVTIWNHWFNLENMVQ